GSMAAARARLAPARVALADVAWIPLLLTLFNGLLALFAYRLWRTSTGLKDAVAAQSQARTQTLAVLKDAAEATRQIADAALLQGRAGVSVELPRPAPTAVELALAHESA